MSHPLGRTTLKRRLARRWMDTPISLRRGTAPVVTLAPQMVAIVRPSASTERDSGDTQEAQADVWVVGPPDLNIQRGDRFNVPHPGGQLYEVKFIQPDRDVTTIAEAVIVA